MNDLISRKAVIDKAITIPIAKIVTEDKVIYRRIVFVEDIENLPSAQPTLCGYNIEHLILIANVLKKENLPPERVVEVLTDIERIVSMVRDEFEETLRKSVEQLLPVGSSF